MAKQVTLASGRVVDVVPGALSITRPSNAESDVAPQIRIYLKVGGQKISVSMSAEAFALAITGMSEVPVEVETPHEEPKDIKKCFDKAWSWAIGDLDDAGAFDRLDYGDELDKLYKAVREQIASEEL